MKKGGHHSEATKFKMSEAAKGNESAKGKHPSIAARKKMSEAAKGRRHSEETKRKMSENGGFRGRKHSEASKNKMREAAKGKRASEATRRKQSKIMKRIRAAEGLKTGTVAERHRVRGRIELRLWREAVFARDNWTCQDCGKRGVELEAHHIKSFDEYPELRTSIENGLTLCKNKCHKKRHKIRKKRRL